MPALKTIPSWHDALWAWFVHHAESRHALAWLALIAFFDTIFLPVAPEFFLAALVLAHPKRWKIYLSVSILSSVAGAGVGYFIARFLFHRFGTGMLHLFRLESSFAHARTLIHGHTFWVMSVASFVPVPDKALIYAAGFLSVRFLPFIAGYFLGRGIRMALVTYLAGKYGKHILDLFNRFALWAGIILLTVLALYGIVHWHLFFF